MIKEFVEVATSFIATASSNERSFTPGELAAKIAGSGGMVIANASTPKKAYTMAMDLSGEYDAIVFAGSLYMIGDIIQDK